MSVLNVSGRTWTLLYSCIALIFSGKTFLSDGVGKTYGSFSVDSSVTGEVGSSSTASSSFSSSSGTVSSVNKYILV